MSVFIPIKSDAAYYDLQVTLEDVTYTLEFRWNVRLEAWFMHILDAEGVNLIRAGLRLVVGWPLNAYAAARTPPGAFLLVDTTGADEEAGLEDLGERHQLVYFSSTELGL
jgi:hypothetical protein